MGFKPPASAVSAVPTIESQVALAAGATYQGDWIDLGTTGAKTVSVVAEADQAGTVYLEDSAIGQTLTPLDLRRLATTPTGVIRKQTDRRYVRLGYINGATLQSLFELNYVVA